MNLGDVPKHLEDMLALVEAQRLRLKEALDSGSLFDDALNKSLVSLTKASKDLSIELRHWSERMKEINQRLTPQETIAALRAAILALPVNLRIGLLDGLGLPTPA